TPWPSPSASLNQMSTSSSQPLSGSPSSSDQPSAQVGRQVPAAEQVVVPWAFAQVLPQAPQFWRVLSAASQPFEPLPSQLAQPAAHTGVHAPPWQLVVPCALVQA